jgi:hypothetical protein
MHPAHNHQRHSASISGWRTLLLEAIMADLRGILAELGGEEMTNDE